MDKKKLNNEVIEVDMSDMSAMKKKLVGKSEKNIRKALKVVDEIEKPKPDLQRKIIALLEEQQALLKQLGRGR